MAALSGKDGTVTVGGTEITPVLDIFTFVRHLLNDLGIISIKQADYLPDMFDIGEFLAPPQQGNIPECFIMMAFYL